jgi:hypothetical protein
MTTKILALMNTIFTIINIKHKDFSLLECDMMMAGTSKMSVHFPHTTKHHIPEAINASHAVKISNPTTRNCSTTKHAAGKLSTANLVWILAH